MNALLVDPAFAADSLGCSGRRAVPGLADWKLRPMGRDLASAPESVPGEDRGRAGATGSLLGRCYAPLRASRGFLSPVWLAACMLLAAYLLGDNWRFAKMVIR